jgi:hypothetical protein
MCGYSTFCYPFISWWIFGLLPLLGSYEWCHCEYSWTYLFLCLGYVTRSRTDRSHGNSLRFWGTNKLCTNVTAPICIPSSNVWVISLSTSLPAVSLSVSDASPQWVGVPFHCGFDWDCPVAWWHWVPVSWAHWLCIFEGMSIAQLV